MLNKLRSAVYSAVGGQEDAVPAALQPVVDPRLPKFPYNRPAFLRLASEDEAQVAGDRSIRPIMVPRDISCMPWMSGYAEAVNAGKSKRNEDNANIHVGSLHRLGEGAGDDGGRSVQYYYFGMFDGHAGHGASTAAANQLHHIIHEKLVDVVDHLLPPSGVPEPSAPVNLLWVPPEELSVDKLVTGALEAAFNDMDALIAEDRRKYEMRGGCTALVALFLLGRLYVANAGDSRAVVCRRGRSLVASHDFTPETERLRVRQLASRQPALCGNEFTHLEFCRRLTRRDLGQRVLYRDAHMTGWAYKTVTEQDIKVPVVCGEGKRSRVCATIGVTRGFGDHGLRAHNTAVFVKPFLLSQPEVLIINLEEEAVTESDVLVMATDGLWDVISNQRMAELVERALSHFPAEDETMRRYRCTSAAQELVMAARGKMRESRQWRRADGSPGTVDDVSVFVIPLLAYREEHLLWKSENAVPTPPPSTPTTNGAGEEPAAADWVPTVTGEGPDPGRWPSPASPAGTTVTGGGTATSALDAGDGGPPERVGRPSPETASGGPTGCTLPAVADGTQAVAEASECSTATKPAPSGGETVGHAVGPRTAGSAPPGPVVPATSGSIGPTPTGPVIRPPSGPVVCAPSGPVLPASPSTIVPTLPDPAVPAPSGLVVCAPSGPVVPPSSIPAVPAPSDPVVHSQSDSVVPPPSSSAVPTPPSPAVPTFSPAVPAPSTPAVPAPSTPAVPAPSTPAVAAPSTLAAPAPSAPVVPTPSTPLVPSRSVPGPAAAPLIVGQTVPPSLVQTVPRSTVQLLPPAPPEDPAPLAGPPR